MKSSTKVTNSSLFPWKSLLDGRYFYWAHLGTAPPQDSHHDLLQRAPVFAKSMLGRNHGLVITLKQVQLLYRSKKNLPKMNLSKWNFSICLQTRSCISWRFPWRQDCAMEAISPRTSAMRAPSSVSNFVHESTHIKIHQVYNIYTHTLKCHQLLSNVCSWHIDHPSTVALTSLNHKCYYLLTSYLLF